MSAAAREFIDASLFMGMHSDTEVTRIACKNFFVARLDRSVLMSYEQVGRCDDVVWQHGRQVQDEYYPFMDNLHTDMRIVRQPYEERDLRLALESPRLRGLSVSEQLLLAMVMNREAVLYSVNSRLAGRSDLPVRTPESGPERSFPGRLEELYRVSLKLRVPATQI